MDGETLAEQFADVTPIEQDDGPTPVVKIAYSQAFCTLMGYFRRVLVDNEYSKRSLQLAAQVIEHNAANYTAWQYRRQCLRELYRDATDEERIAAWREELAYCSEQCMNNTKNYQVWFHRRACVGNMGDATGELDFVASVLEDDSKNYHAWGHRQWVLKQFDLWADELSYIDRLLEEDVRNNSAWNQRYFVLKATTDLTSTATVASEVDYTLTHIAKAPSNQSPWAFLKGLVQPLGYLKYPQVREACERLGANDGTPGATPCLPALAMLVDILLESGETVRAAELCAQLASADQIRERYWQWRRARTGATAPVAAASTAPPSIEIS
jgi:protein farnesyltransferase/geranylgeranyltransferase type-1 subunit alpha